MKFFNSLCTGIAVFTSAVAAGPMILQYGNVTQEIHLKPRQGPVGGGPNQRINAIWSNRGTESVDLGGGNQIAINSGFTLVDEHNQVIWSNPYPVDYSPCMAGGGSTFTLSKGCLGGHTYKFNCVGDWTLKIDSCEVREGDSVIASAKGEHSEHYYGIGVTQENTCGTSFILANDIHCEESKDIEACCHEHEG